MKENDELSFLPDDYLERKALRRTNAICASLFGMVIVSIGTAFLATERSTKTVTAQYEAKLREYTDAATRIKQANEMRDKQKKMAHQAELAASLLEKVPRSFILADITNAMPNGVSLLEYTLETRKRVVVESHPVGQLSFDRRQQDEAAKKNAGDPFANAQPNLLDVSMRITGVATTDVDVAQFITRLNANKMLKDVNLVISDEFEKDKQKVRRFQIEANLDPDAEIKPNEAALQRAAATFKQAVTGG